MQKKLIALAIASLGASSVAFAQSNVTISGQIKGSVESVSAGGATSSFVPAAGGAAVTGTTYNPVSRMRVTDGTTEIRFSGEEALGNGLTAFWQVASDVFVDAGGGTFGSRNTGVGLRSATAGSVMIGRWDVHYTTHSAVDAAGLNDLPLHTNALSIIGSVQVGSTGVGGGLAGSTQGTLLMGGRQNNVVAYMSPNWNGFSFLAGYTFQSEATTGNLNAKDRGWVFSPSYVNGPLAVTYSHLDVKHATATIAGATISAGGTVAAGTIAAAATGGTTAPAAAFLNSGANVKSDKLGASYSFPMGLKVGFIYDRSQVTDNSTGLSLGKRNAWALPISYTTGNHTMYFTYGKAGNTTESTAAIGGTNVTVSDTGATFNMLAYSYALSKRTAVNASWTRINNKANAMYDFWARGVGNLTPGSDPQAISVGIRHTF